uniref:Uncharacterized protein n=1 Tax=mine drainage metagenome TaxID=410659 RepID=E6PTD0_9ZZZZ
MSDMSQQHDVQLSVGMAHLGLQQVTRVLSDAEPPALAPNAHLHHVGKSVPRWDAREKITGAARFTVDIDLAGHALRGPAALARTACPHPRARPVRGAPRHQPGIGCRWGGYSEHCRGGTPC